MLHVTCTILFFLTKTSGYGSIFYATPVCTCTCIVTDSEAPLLSLHFLKREC